MPGGRTDVPGVWLLDLTVDGRVYRYATEGVVVTTAAGDDLVYAEGLVEPSLTYGQVLGVGTASVAIELQADVDWALLIERGHSLDRAPAVLRRWYPGRTLERARVVLRGLVEAPVYGAKGEPLSISIVRSMREQTRTIPPAQAVVDASTWPIGGAGYRVPEKAQGAAYPLVIGCPGHTDGASPVPCVPVPLAEVNSTATTGLVVWLGGHATQVRLRRAHLDPVTEADVSVGTSTDLLGRVVQSLDPTPASSEEGEYLLGFQDDGSYGGGILYRGALLRGAGAVIEWALREHYDGAVDFGRLTAARVYLDAWKIDTYINSPVNAWDWLSREVLPLLPVEMREGADGIYPALIRYDLSRADAVVHLNAALGSGRVQREGPVASLADIANEITIEYRPGPEAGARWLARRIVTAQPSRVSGAEATDTADERIIGSIYASESQRRYGIRPLRIQASAVWDHATAVLTARSILQRRALPRRTLRYVGGPWLEELEIGAAVTLTDPELHLSEALAVVYDVQAGSESAVDLILLDDPAERRRAT